MNASKPARTRSFRLLAAGVAVLWLGALVLCSGHCGLGQPASASKHACCQSGSDRDGHSQPASSAPKVPQGGWFCVSLKDTSSSHAQTTAPTPDLLTIPWAVAWPVVELTVAEPAFLLTPHRTPSPFRLFTPEVFLGPALHSLAPPLSPA